MMPSPSPLPWCVYHVSFSQFLYFVVCMVLVHPSCLLSSASSFFLGMRQLPLSMGHLWTTFFCVSFSFDCPMVNGCR